MGQRVHSCNSWGPLGQVVSEDARASHINSRARVAIELADDHAAPEKEAPHGGGGKQAAATSCTALEHHDRGHEIDNGQVQEYHECAYHFVHLTRAQRWVDQCTEAEEQATHLWCALGIWPGRLTWKSRGTLKPKSGNRGSLHGMEVTRGWNPRTQSRRLPQEEDARSERALKGIAHRGAHRPSSYTLAIGPGPA